MGFFSCGGQLFCHPRNHFNKGRTFKQKEHAMRDFCTVCSLWRILCKQLMNECLAEQTSSHRVSQTFSSGIITAKCDSFLLVVREPIPTDVLTTSDSSLPILVSQGSVIDR